MNVNPETLDRWKAMLNAWLSEMTIDASLREAIPDDDDIEDALPSTTLEEDEEFRVRARSLVAPFDEGIEVGQVRLLSPQLAGESMVYVAVIGHWEDEGVFVVVPFSPYTVPATPAEVMLTTPLGHLRVFQAWNAVLTPPSVLAKSWVAGEVTDEDVADGYAVFANVLTGKPLPPGLEEWIGPPICNPRDPRTMYEDSWTRKLSRFRGQATEAVESE